MGLVLSPISTNDFIPTVRLSCLWNSIWHASPLGPTESDVKPDWVSGMQLMTDKTTGIQYTYLMPNPKLQNPRPVCAFRRAAFYVNFTTQAVRWNLPFFLPHSRLTEPFTPQPDSQIRKWVRHKYTRVPMFQVDFAANQFSISFPGSRRTAVYEIKNMASGALTTGNNFRIIASVRMREYQAGFEANF
jgi:hypothetical protein